MTRTAHTDLDIHHARWLFPQPVSKHIGRQAGRKEGAPLLDSGYVASYCGKKDAIKKRRDDSRRMF